MKTIVSTLLIVLLSMGAFAQKRSDFRGPDYKNYKQWLYKSQPIVLYTLTNKTKLIGSAYKNAKPWQKSLEKSYTSVVFGTERSKLKGPAYKNYKPWLNK